METFHACQRSPQPAFDNRSSSKDMVASPRMALEVASLWLSSRDASEALYDDRLVATHPTVASCLARCERHNCIFWGAHPWHCAHLQPKRLRRPFDRETNCPVRNLHGIVDSASHARTCARHIGKQGTTQGSAANDGRTGPECCAHGNRTGLIPLAWCCLWLSVHGPAAGFGHFF